MDKNKKVTYIEYDERTDIIKLQGSGLAKIVGIRTAVIGWGDRTHHVITDGGDDALATLSQTEAQHLPTLTDRDVYAFRDTVE
jgi:hypothetical protein